jgi:hypothetical protein
MDQKTKNQDEEVAAFPSINQRQGEKNREIATENEQGEEASLGEEGTQGERGGGVRGGESHSETRKNQRGKYRQYEDSNIILEKIRYYRTQRYPDSEIMKFLDNMPRRTYYNYVKKLQEQERKITEQWMSEHTEHYAEELMIYREALCQKLREIQGIIDNKNTPPKDKMQAIAQYLAITDKLVNFERSGRVEAMEYVKGYVSTLY